MSDQPDTSPYPPERLAQRFATPVSGPAYRMGVKMMTLSTVLGLVAYGAQVLAARSGGVDSTFLLLMAGAGAIVLINAWYILAGRTTIDARGIRQDWMFGKEFAWHEIMRARAVRMPFTRRLVLSTGRGPMKAIHGGCRELDEAFAEITRIYADRAP